MPLLALTSTNSLIFLCTVLAENDRSQSPTPLPARKPGSCKSKRTSGAVLPFMAWTRAVPSLSRGLALGSSVGCVARVSRRIAGSTGEGHTVCGFLECSVDVCFRGDVNVLVAFVIVPIKVETAVQCS